MYAAAGYQGQGQGVAALIRLAMIRIMLKQLVLDLLGGLTILRTNQLQRPCLYVF